MTAHAGTTAPVRVGLIGAGPWARTMHARMLAAGPETTLAAVWARRRKAAVELAEPYGAVVADSPEELFDRCEAVAFAVPPAVQAPLAIRAARAGKALLLEKPLAADLAGARELAAAVAESGVVSQLVLTKRYHPSTAEFLERARTAEVYGARSCYLHGAFLGGEQATGWRLAEGALLDLGPHLLDLLDAAIGPISTLRAVGDPRRWVELTCEHASGAISQASLSGAVSLPRARTRVELLGPGPELSWDSADIDHDDCWPILRAQFAAAVRSGNPGPLDAARGLHLQQLIATATASL
jgi:predicted dehydrogenase